MILFSLSKEKKLHEAVQTIDSQRKSILDLQVGNYTQAKFCQLKSDKHASYLFLIVSEWKPKLEIARGTGKQRGGWA